MKRQRYETMKRSACPHKRTIAGAVERIVTATKRTGSRLPERTDAHHHITMGCFALDIAPVLYSGSARRVIEYHDYHG